MDEHTDWVNQLIYLENTEAVVSCSNDTTIKLWMLPFTGGNLLPELSQAERDMGGTSASTVGPATSPVPGAGGAALRVNSFYTIDSHQDYVRAMAYSKEPGRLFSISDDGQLMIHDLSEQGMVAEYNTLRGKYPQFGNQYVPVYKGGSGSRQPGQFVFDHKDFTVSSESCPTCIAASESGNVILVGYSDDSIILQDIRSQYQERIRLEVGGHTDTVKSIRFSQQDGDFLCLTGGSDCQLKLWDLRQRKCIRDYGGNEGEMPAAEFGMFHNDSIWAIEPTRTFDTCYTGGRDGQIIHTDLAGDQHTLLYAGNKTPINCLCLDEANKQLWFTSASDSSIKYLDLAKRGPSASRAGAAEDTVISDEPVLAQPGRKQPGASATSLAGTGMAGSSNQSAN